MLSSSLNNSKAVKKKTNTDTLKVGVKHGSLRKNIIQKLSVFERKILRKVSGPTKKKDGSWKINTNIGFDELIQHRNIKYVNP